MRCPFVYASGKHCSGRVVRVEAFKADLAWTSNDSGGDWNFSWSARSHFHLFCSDKGNHAGTVRPDSDQMKFYWDQLPEDVQQLLDGTQPAAGVPQSTAPS
jgi:hypothetical protein